MWPSGAWNVHTWMPLLSQYVILLLDLLGASIWSNLCGDKEEGCQRRRKRQDQERQDQGKASG